MTEFYTNVRQWGNDILYIGYDDKGNRVQKREAFKPKLYVPATQDKQVEAHCYDGTALSSLDFETIKEAKNFVKEYDGCSNFQLYGMDKYNYQFITRKFVDDIKYNIDTLRIQFFDIEVDSSNGFPDPYDAVEEITAITIKDIKFNKYHVWCINDKYGGNFDTNNYKHIEKEIGHIDLEKHDYDNEIDMLRDFLFWFSNNYPDILSGWYSRDFDVPYIVNRLRNVLGKQKTKALSPWGIIQERTSSVKRFGQQDEKTVYDIYGISELDYLDLYKKYTYTTSESFALDFIANKHLGVGKLEYDGSLDDLLRNDYQTYVEYNIIDVERIHNLDVVLKFIELILEVSYQGKVATYNDSLGTVKFWEVLVYNHLVETDRQPELKKISASKDEQYPGGRVKEPIPGMYKWVMSFDLTSLYPMIIRQVNIGPETHIAIENIPDELLSAVSSARQEKIINKKVDLKMLKKYDVSMSGNRQLYSRDKQSFFSELMEKFFNKRKEYKSLMFDAIEAQDKDAKATYHTKQLAYKILINSAYGAIGNGYFQYFSVDNAAAVTVTGQIVISWIEQRLNIYLNNLLGTEDKDRIIAIDTDSVYIDMSDLVNKILPDETDAVKITKFLDKVGTDKIEPYINTQYAEFFDYMNHYENFMRMDREIISDKAIWTGKKRYVMNVYDKEGEKFYDDPDLKVCGVEIVKSSTPKVCRDKLKEAVQMLLRSDNETLLDFIEDFKAEWKQLPASAVSFPRGVNGIDKYDINTKGCPIHVRGALVHNSLLKKKKVDKIYSEIKDGTKIKFAYLREPNPTHQNVIAFAEELPAEFELEKYIDYDAQFEKAFLAPLQAMTNLIDWKTERVNDLSSLFE